MKKYGTLEELCKAPEAEIAELLHMRAAAASELLLAAKNMFSKQTEKKNEQSKSLQEAGTTWQNAAHYKMINDWALEAAASDEEAGEDEKDEGNS